MKRGTRHFPWLLVVSLSSLFAGEADSASAAKESIILFASSGCRECEEIKAHWAAEETNYPDLELVFHDILEIDNFKRFLALEKEWEKEAGSSFPVVAYRRTFFYGDNVVEDFKRLLLHLRWEAVIRRVGAPPPSVGDLIRWMRIVADEWRQAPTPG